MNDINQKVLFGFSVIPNSIKYDPNIKPLAKFILSDILSFTSTNQCYASNQYFADLYDVSIRTIEGNIKALRDKGYIETEYNPKTNRRIILPTHKIWEVYDNVRNINRHVAAQELEQVEANPPTVEAPRGMRELSAMWGR